MSGLEIKHKKNIHIVRWGIALLVFALLIAYGYFGIRWYNTGELSPMPLPVAAADASINESPVTRKQIDAHTSLPAEPRYIEIPNLGIDKARVSRVGTTERKMLDTPKNIDDAGWYTKSSTPGSGSGAVMINAHSNGVSRSGLFAKLKTLKSGDQVTIERGDRKSFTYEVEGIRDMPLDWVNRVGMKEMMQSIRPEKEGLSLIADSGKWIPKDKVFDRRILVRATLIE